MNCFHPSDLGQTLALTPAFAPRGAGHLGDEDRGFDGVVNHAPGSGLVRRQANQIGQIGTSAPTPATSCRAGDGVKAPVAEGLATDPAEARFSRWNGHLSHIFAAGQLFKIAGSPAAAEHFAHSHSGFLRKSPSTEAILARVQDLEL
jgi:hypothetical protein